MPCDLYPPASNAYNAIIPSNCEPDHSLPLFSGFWSDVCSKHQGKWLFLLESLLPHILAAQRLPAQPHQLLASGGHLGVIRTKILATGPGHNACALPPSILVIYSRAMKIHLAAML